MAILAGIIGMLGRFAGQVLNTTLGWATLLLFGKVPQKRQTLLLVIVFGSLIWVALVVGVLVPPVGDLIVSAVPRPDFVPESWVRLGILAGALLLPLLIGLAALFVSAKRERSLVGNIVTVLRGYPFAAVLTLVLVLLALVGTWRKLRSLAHRWTDAHVPIVVMPGGYDAVLADLVGGLKQAGIEVTPTDAGVFLSGPPKLLDLIAGRGLGELVPDRLMVLHGRDLEVLVYPSDIAISGTPALLARARNRSTRAWPRCIESTSSWHRSPWTTTNGKCSTADDSRLSRNSITASSGRERTKMRSDPTRAARSHWASWAWA